MSRARCLLIPLLACVASAPAASVTVNPGQPLIAAANRAQEGDVLRVAPGRYAGGVITRSHITLGRAGEGKVLLTGTVSIHASHVVLEGLTWEDLNGQLVNIRGQHNVVRRCEFRRFGRTGPSKAIWIREDGDYSHCVIEQCLFEDWGNTKTHSSCIKIGQYTNRSAHRGAIVRECVFRRGAVGGNNPAIQPFCPSIIERNVIHDCEDGVEGKGSHMVVRHNVIYRCRGGESMSNRSGSNNLFEGNLLYDIPVAPLQVWTGKGNVWRNNVVVGCNRIAHIKGGNTPQGRAVDALFIHNTFVGNGRGITWHNRQFAPTGVRFINNIFVGTGEGRPVIESPKQRESTADYVEDYNLVFGYAPPVGRPLGPHSLMGKDPQFVDAAGRDFRLLPTSPARNAGLPSHEHAPQTDKDGAPRPQGEGVDMGAFEHPAH